MASPLAARAEAALVPWLGTHTAKRAVAIACLKLRRDAEALVDADAEALAEALRPMLRTLAGRDVTEQIVRSIVGDR